MSRKEWTSIGKKAGWMKTSQEYNRQQMLKDELAVEEKQSQKTLNGKPILNPENSDLENLYYVAFGGVTNTGLIGFDGYVYAFEEQEALDRVLDKYPNLGLDETEVKDYPEDSISYGGNKGIPYLSEDLRAIKLIRKAQ